MKFIRYVYKLYLNPKFSKNTQSEYCMKFDGFEVLTAVAMKSSVIWATRFDISEDRILHLTTTNIGLPNLTNMSCSKYIQQS
jgi:hypothetical protein